MTVLEKVTRCFCIVIMLVVAIVLSLLVLGAAFLFVYAAGWVKALALVAVLLAALFVMHKLDDDDRYLPGDRIY